MNEEYNAIGLMSGTSMDGLDLAFCHFLKDDSGWSYSVLETTTTEYPAAWIKRLQTFPELDGYSLIKLHIEYGKFLADQVLQFMKVHSIKPDLLASHGHTLFHKPSEGVTFQLGNGQVLAAETGFPVVYDFRTQDVALGGQGAPLVPVGDRLLFKEYDICLNLGGFSNLSFEESGRRIAFDPSPSNLAINYLIRSTGEDMDRDGATGRQGAIHKKLLEELNGIPYYHRSGARSLGREWLEEEFFPVLDSFQISLKDKLRTVYEHIAIQITRTTAHLRPGKLLITGGGAHNTFLVERIEANTYHKVILPGKKIIDFKEALIFAFLGVLRMRNEVNCLASVTGAQHDHSTGVIVTA